MSNDAKRMHYSEYPTIDMVFEEAEVRNKVNLSKFIHFLLQTQANMKTMHQQNNNPKMTIEDFDIQNVLGEGSFGHVYKALDNENGKTVAIKIISKLGQKREQLAYIHTEV